MATRKPDWAQRAVEKLHHNELVPRTMDNLKALYLSQAATLLRAHHRKVKRMVQKLNQDSAYLYINCNEISAYRLACEHILDKLEELER